MLVAKHVLYSGRVQGVGFRYTAVRLAQGLGVGGYVRNLANGQVELVAEGSPAEVEELLRRISAAMAGHVNSVESTDVAPTGHAGFKIRH